MNFQEKLDTTGREIIDLFCQFIANKTISEEVKTKYKPKMDKILYLFKGLYGRQ